MRRNGMQSTQRYRTKGKFSYRSVPLELFAAAESFIYFSKEVVDRGNLTCVFIIEIVGRFWRIISSRLWADLGGFG
uniref:Uncharacterized protein n=1 Tax=Romanomermis culicivorax TaxID=13658 RepID=A0A915IQD5_ROMCU